MDADEYGCVMVHYLRPSHPSVVALDPQKALPRASYFHRMRLNILTGLVLLLVSCTRSAFTSKDEAAIREVMSAQEKAWDQGDIPSFMEGYADSVCFVSKKGTTCGKAGVTANYQKHYPDKAAMGDLSFGGLEILGAGADHAWCTGTWELIRAQDTLGGGFSLLWERHTEGWRILRDHTY